MVPIEPPAGFEGLTPLGFEGLLGVEEGVLNDPPPTPVPLGLVVPELLEGFVVPVFPVEGLVPVE